MKEERMRQLFNDLFNNRRYENVSSMFIRRAKEITIALLTSRFLFDKDERVLLEIDDVVDDDDGERKFERRR